MASSLRNWILVATTVAVALCTVLFGGVETRVAGPVAAALCALGILSLGPAGAGRVRLHRDWALVGLALPVASGLVTLLWSVNPHATLEWSVRAVAVVAAYGLFRYLPGSPGIARRVLFCLVMVVAGTAGYGLVMALADLPWVLWVRKQAYLDSVTGTFINRNHFASFLGMFVYAGAGLYASAQSRNRWPLLGGLIVGLVAIPLTLSRGGIAAALLPLPFFLLALAPAGRRRLRPLLGVLALAVLVGGATRWDRLSERFGSALTPTAEFSAAARLSMWKSAAQAAADRPLGGFGAGTFESFYPRYRELGINRRVSFAHHDYLQLASEQGALGILALLAGLAMVVGVFRTAVTRAGEHRPELVGIGAGLGVVAIHAALDFPFGIPAIALGAAALLGLGLRLAEATDDSRLSPRSSRGLAVLACLILTVTAVYAVTGTIADGHRRRAEDLFPKPDWDGAAVAYQQAIRFDPLDARSWEGLARTELNRAKFRREQREELLHLALDHLAVAERLDPMRAEHNMHRAWLFNFQHDYAHAATEYELALADDPHNANVLFHTAALYLHRKQLGRFERGIELMTQGVRIFPQFFGGKVHELHYLLGDTQTLLQLIPRDEPFLMFQLAVYLYEYAHELEPARIAFAETMRHSDWREDWLLQFSGVVARTESPAAALELLAEVPTDRVTPAVAVQVAKLHRVAGDMTAAKATLLAAAERFPTDSEILRWQVELGVDDAELRTGLERYRGLVGEDAGYHVVAGRLAFRRGNFAEALAAFEAAAALNPADARARDGLQMLGQATSQGGDR